MCHSSIQGTGEAEKDRKETEEEKKNGWLSYIPAGFWLDHTCAGSYHYISVMTG